MERTIWKYPLVVTDRQEILMPELARLLTVQVQHRIVNLWAMVAPAAAQRKRRLAIIGTGHAILPVHGLTEATPYVGTFQLHGGQLIFHVFDLGETGSAYPPIAVAAEKTS